MRKVVFAGCGGITRAWMSAIQDFDDVEVVGLCDLDLPKTNDFAEKWKLPSAIRGNRLEEVIKASGADTVFDCTVPSAHKSVTIAALSAGCDILGEKPMAESLDDARLMVQKASESGQTYAVIQNRRYNPDIIQYQQALKQPEIGTITGLHADFFLGAHFTGFRTQMDHVLLLDMAIHSFDEARFISGCDPVAVTAFDWNPKGSWYRHGANATATFEMTDGLVFTYRGSWCAEGMNTSWECGWRGTGENGTVSWDGFSDITGEYVLENDGFMRKTQQMKIKESPPIEHRSHAGVIREFIDSLETGKKPQTHCTDNIKSVAMVLAAIKSAEKGKRIEISV